jgi:hypothetical protein
MNDEERADWLARAIDDLLSRDRQRPTESPPPELERQELNSLLRIAGDRLDAADTRMQAGLQYEGEVWRGVLRKLDRRKKPRKKTSAAGSKVLPEQQFDLEQNLDQFEIEELRQIAKMRREMAEQAAMIAEAHRDDVWQRVQSRMNATPQAKPQRSGRFPFFWMKRTDDGAAQGRAPAKLQELEASGRAEMESLLDIAGARSYLSQMAKASAGERQQRVWGGITRTIKKDKRYKLDERADRGAWWPGLAYGAALIALLVVAFRTRDKKREPDEQTAVAPWWPRAAAAAVTLAVVVAAIAPLPATGFADHPAIELGRSIAERVGVRETNARPPAPGLDSPVAFPGREVTLSEASTLIGAQLRVPPAPEGFELRATRFFEGAVTADSGGAYALTYVGPENKSLVVFQERASGADLSAAEGSATNVILDDGTAATYVRGAWEPVDADISWDADGGQTLVFERGGVRTTVQYTGPEATAPSLFAVADSMTAGS